MAASRKAIMESLLSLSHELGSEERGMAILGEGNTSARIDGDHFFVKASGSSLSNLRTGEVVECDARKLLPLLNSPARSDEEVETILLGSRVDTRGRKPSVEALFHAFLLSLEGINFVGHTHPIGVNQILCSRRGREFAEKRIFPDEIVCCGARSVYVPYTDPGVVLANLVRANTLEHVRQFGGPPKVILVQNHGVITLGRTPEAVLAAMLMAEKAARVWAGASLIGGPVFLSREQVARIATRLDERYRQQALKI